MQKLHEAWTLFLPIGTIQSERLLYLLEFLNNKSITIVYLQMKSSSQSNEDFKNLEKTPSSDGSKRSITSSLSKRSDEHSFNEKTQNLDNDETERTNFISKSGKFEKKASFVEPVPEKRPSLSLSSRMFQTETPQFINLFTPTLQVGDFLFFHKMQIICILLLENFGIGNGLGVLKEETKAPILDQIERIELKIDQQVQRLMSFVYLDNIEADGVIKDPTTMTVRLNWNSYQLIIDNLIKELEYIFNKYMCQKVITNDSELTLTDVYLTCALNRIYKFLFDPIFSKSWVSNTTNWFLKITKRKDFENAFGKFRFCKISYTSLLDHFDNNSEVLEKTPEIRNQTWGLAELKKHIKEVNQLRLNLSDFSEKTDVNNVRKINLDAFKNDAYHFWIFSYIPIEEYSKSRKNSNKAQDEVSVFYESFCKEAEAVVPDFLIFVVLSSKCESMTGFAISKRNLESCKTHAGNYFVNSEITGIVIAQSEVCPSFINQYDQKDILDVKKVTKNQIDILENLIQRKEEFAFEKVLSERLF